MAPPPLPSPPPSSRPPPQLPEEIVEEILIRFPPGEPASLLRAALVCKRWRRLVSGAGFRVRFGEFHRIPPTLGMFCNGGFMSEPHFVPTTAFRPRHGERGLWRVLGARHGRVLLHGQDGGLSVWDPVTDEERKMPSPPQCAGSLCWAAAVVCDDAGAGAGGCDHLDCYRRHFIVVFVDSVLIDPDTLMTFIYTYSSNAAAWSEPICSQRPGYLIDCVSRAIVGNTLYFGNWLDSSTFLKYNTQLRQMSWIQVPYSFPFRRPSALTPTEDGGLRLAGQHENKLYIWSTKDADEVETRWEQNRVINLDTLLPVDADLTSLAVVGCMDDLSTIFVGVDDVAYAIDLRTYKVKKVHEGTIDTIIPYMSFYTPALQADDTGDGGSSA